MSIFYFVGRYSDRIVVPRFVLGMHTHGIYSMTRERGAQWMTAAGSSDVSGFIELEIKRLRSVSVVIKWNIFSFVWRKKPTLSVVLVPWLARIFVFFVAELFAKIFFEPHSASAALPSLFLWPSSSADAPFDKKIFTSSTTRVSVTFLLESLLSDTLSSYSACILSIGFSSLSA